MKNSKIKVLTWHVHGSYLYYLTQTDCEFFLPKKNNNEAGYGGKTSNYNFGDNVHEIPAEKIKNLHLDIILFQSKKNYSEDQYEILSEKQLSLPKIYLEHDPPREHPTDTKHIVDDPNILLIHVTHFNELMWDSGSTPTKVIDHGVSIPKGIEYTGEKNKGIVVVNNIGTRGRRLGLDIFENIRKQIPLDIIGMGSEDVGGLGEIRHSLLPAFLASYRFFFNPIRYTSLGLSVIEALMVGLPVIGLATTEMPTVITNGINGYVDTDLDNLIYRMQTLLKNKDEAEELSNGAKILAEKHFNIHRFMRDWESVFTLMNNKKVRLDRIRNPERIVKDLI